MKLLLPLTSLWWCFIYFDRKPALPINDTVRYSISAEKPDIMYYKECSRNDNCYFLNARFFCFFLCPTKHNVSSTPGTFSSTILAFTSSFVLFLSLFLSLSFFPSPLVVHILRKPHIIVFSSWSSSPSVSLLLIIQLSMQLSAYHSTSHSLYTLFDSSSLACPGVRLRPKDQEQNSFYYFTLLR